MVTSVVQAKCHVAGNNNVVLDSAPTEGNTLVAITALNLTENPTPASGWTLEYSGGAGGSNFARPHVLSKVAGSSESATQNPTTSGSVVWATTMFEIEDLQDTYANEVQTEDGDFYDSTDAYDAAEVTATASGNTLILVGGGVRGDFPTAIPTFSGVDTVVTGANNASFNRAAFGGYHLAENSETVTLDMNWLAQHNSNGVILVALNAFTPVDTTDTLDPGSFALTGIDANELFGYSDALDPGSFTLTGNSISQHLSELMGTGEFTLTGKDIYRKYHEFFGTGNFLLKAAWHSPRLDHTSNKTNRIVNRKWWAKLLRG